MIKKIYRKCLNKLVANNIVIKINLFIINKI